VLSATVPGDDREWIAADQATKVCVSYHDIATFNIDVNCSFDAGANFTQLGTAIDAPHAFLLNDNSTGNLTIDPTITSCTGVFRDRERRRGCRTTGFHAVWIAISHDGGVTFTDNTVYVNPNTSVSYGHQFINASVDRAGTCTSCTTTTTISFTVSRPIMADVDRPDPGQPVSIRHGRHAVERGVRRGRAGHRVVRDVVLRWDGAGQFPGVAAWYVYMAQNRTATTVGSSFTQVAATPIIHYGGVCEGGVSCTGNRDLYDDFGIAVSPTTGLASIVYSDDQPGTPGVMITRRLRRRPRGRRFASKARLGRLSRLRRLRPGAWPRVSRCTLTRMPGPKQYAETVVAEMNGPPWSDMSR